MIVERSEGKKRLIATGRKVDGVWQVKTFLPEACITFEVFDAAQHHHVPLLLSPFGFSTYRGS